MTARQADGGSPATRIRWAVLLVSGASLLAPSGARAEAERFSVTVAPMPAPTVQTFSAHAPPEGVDPTHGSDIRMSFAWSGASHRGSFDGTVYTITGVGGITVTGEARILRPESADRTSNAHETGHVEVMRDIYRYSARRRFEEAFRGFGGMRFVGRGDSPEARQRSAFEQADAERARRAGRAIDAILTEVSLLGEQYDNLARKDAPEVGDVAVSQPLDDLPQPAAAAGKPAKEITRAEFEANAPAIFREVEATGAPVLVTDRGLPRIEVRRYGPGPTTEARADVPDAAE